MNNQDPYLRKVADFKPRRGFSALDESRTFENRVGERGFSGIKHHYEGNSHKRYLREMRRDPQDILCMNAAAAMDKRGIVHHAWVGDERLIGFAGFVAENQEDGRVFVFTRGKILLWIEGIKKDSKGMTVHAEGPNKFNLEGVGFEIGRIRFIENIHANVVSVAFKSYDDPNPLDLSL